jgi:hypothetical protein
LYLDKICTYYFDNPYHNFYHGVYVLQACFSIVNGMGGEQHMTPQERFLLMLSAVTHDVGHPGINNAFLVTRKEKLALHFQDQSVLENMHFTLMWELLKDPAFNFMGEWEGAQVEHAKETLRSCLLATDMAAHGKFLGAFKEQMGNGQVDAPTAMAIILKMADISNPAKPFVQSQEWNMRIVLEFFAQGDLEIKGGAEPAPHMKRTSNEVQNCINFATFVVKPLVASFVEWLPQASPLSVNLFANEAILKKQVDGGKLSSHGATIEPR